MLRAKGEMLCACADAKRIAPAAWEELAAAYGGGPALADADACGACLAASLQAAADAQAGSAQRDSVLRMLAALDEEGEGGAQPQPGDYFVSKPWLTCGG
jgi:hypothetical protein